MGLVISEIGDTISSKWSGVTESIKERKKDRAIDKIEDLISELEMQLDEETNEHRRRRIQQKIDSLNEKKASIQLYYTEDGNTTADHLTGKYVQWTVSVDESGKHKEIIREADKRVDTQSKTNQASAVVQTENLLDHNLPPEVPKHKLKQSMRIIIEDSL